MPTSWRVYGAHTVACRLDRCDLPGLFRKKVVVGLGEAAAILRDGQIQAFLTESSAEAANILDQLGSLFRLGAEIAVYFVDIAPLDLSIFIGNSAKGSVTADGTRHAASAKSIGWAEEAGNSASVHSDRGPNVSEVNILALSADKEVIQAECRLRVHIDPEDPAPFIAAMKGKRALATWDLARLVRDEVVARVLVPEIARHPAADFRGNPAVRHAVEQAALQRLQGTVRPAGLILDAFTVLWGTTPAEAAEIARRQADRAEQALEFAKGRQVAHLRRQHEVETARLVNLHELKQAAARGDSALAELLLAGEIRRDLMTHGKRVDEARVDAAVRDIQLSIEKNESLLRLEQQRAGEELRLDLEDREFKQRHTARLAALDLEDRELRSMVQAQIEVSTAKHDRELAKRRQELDGEFRKTQADIEDRYQQRRIKLEESLARMGMVERLVSQGVQAGAADAGVLNTMLRQATEQEYATTSDEKVRARAGADAAGQSLETYRQAEDRDRRHQAAMTGLAADLMQAAKPASAAPPPVAGALRAASTCGGCAGPVEVSWKACPHCGTPLRRACASCGAALQAAWKACPLCGVPTVA